MQEQQSRGKKNWNYVVPRCRPVGWRQTALGSTQFFFLSTWAHFVLRADRLSQQFLTSRALDLHRLRRVCVEVVAGPSLVGPCVAGGMIEIPSVYFDFVVKYQ